MLVNFFLLFNCNIFLTGCTIQVANLFQVYDCSNLHQSIHCSTKTEKIIGGLLVMSPGSMYSTFYSKWFIN